MFSFQNVWPTKRKAVCTLVIFHIYSPISLRELDKIYLNFLFNFSKPSSGCKQLEVLLQAANFTGYRLIRRTLKIIDDPHT